MCKKQYLGLIFTIKNRVPTNEALDFDLERSSLTKAMLKLGFG